MQKEDNNAMCRCGRERISRGYSVYAKGSRGSVGWGICAECYTDFENYHYPPLSKCVICEGQSGFEPQFCPVCHMNTFKGAEPSKPVLTDEAIIDVGFALYNYRGQKRLYMECHKEYEDKARELLSSLPFKSVAQVREETLKEVQVMLHKITEDQGYATDASSITALADWLLKQKLAQNKEGKQNGAKQ